MFSNCGDLKKVLYLKIVITDTGYGIPPEQQAKIFTKMFRADNAREKVAEGTDYQIIAEN